MAPDSRPEPGQEEGAGSIFAEHVHGLVPGAAPDVEALCMRHPRLAAELRALAEAWKRFEARRERLGRATPGEVLRARHGEEIDPGVSLQGRPAEETPGSGPSSELLLRLRSHAPANSRYRILGEVGRGGMGAVLRIWDEDLRRLSAMKVVLGKEKPEDRSDTPAVDAHTLGRFLEEAQVTGQLDHPGIVPVHELGLGQDGQVYFTMRLVKGDDLRAIFERVKTGQDGWNPTRALGVLLKVCEAMAYAHDKGVLHRDLKAANVMVGKYGEAYVMDWGLARVLGQKDRHDLRLQPPIPTTQSAIKTDRRAERHETPDSPLVTMDGAVIGTPAYMPPEQARGEIEALGPHSDVYALGAMLYELLAGQMPFVPPGARVSPYTVLMRVLEGPPRALVELAPRAPAELVAICEKAMARESSRRYRDMTELAADLRAFLERRVVKAHATGTWAETKKWVQRNRPLAASLAAVVLVLVAGVVTSTLYAREAEAARVDLADKNGELIVATRLADERAETANRLRQEAEDRGREARLRGLIQELEYFDTLDDDVYTYARLQTRPAHEWWIEKAQLLVEGRAADPARGLAWAPGLTDVQAQLAKLRARARAPTEAELAADRADHPKAKELEATSAEVLWLSRMLGMEPWPKAGADTGVAEATGDASELNGRAWLLVKPYVRRSFGKEQEALELAQRAVGSAADEERAMYRDTLAWALLWAGQLEEALEEEARAVEEIEVAKRADYEDLLRQMEAEVRSFRDGTAAARRETLVAETRTLEQAVSEEWRYLFDESQDDWWHGQLVRLEQGLVRLSERLELARTSVRSPANAILWSEAITAIANSPRYGGLRITPQLGLVPIGPDPSSGLWEFAHLATGEPERRGADGKLLIAPEMGLVLVLLPGGRVPVAASDDDDQDVELTRIDLDPFFLSKYEMTQEQWDRIGGWRRGDFGSASALLPASDMSWDDGKVALPRTGWLRLPSEAQWEYACRAETTTPWWTGAEHETLRSAANIDFGDPDNDLQRIGLLAANPFGLHDVHGNVWEWCGDSHSDGVPRQEDGLRDEPGAAYRVLRGGVYSNEAKSARSSFRFGDRPDYRDDAYGLRPARGITP